MARKARWLGLLATYRELSPREREAVDRALEDDPQGRELARRFAEQDALLASLTPPCPSAAMKGRVMAATVARGDGALRPRWRPVFAAVVSLLLLVLVAGTGMASSGSLPGDSLYPVKRAGEQVRLALTLRDQGRARYAERLEEVRRQEVNALLGLGRDGIPVAFEGPLEHSPEGEWLVAGVPIVLSEDAGDPSQMVAGLPVYITGEVAQTQVRVQTMRPLAPSSVPANHPVEPQHTERRGSEPQASTRTPVPPSPEPTADSPRGDDQPEAEEAESPPTATPDPTLTPTAAKGPDGPKGTPPGHGQPSRSTPPGQDKAPQTPAAPAPKDDEDKRDADASADGQGQPPAAPEPTTASRGSVDRAPDGRPQPTRRPPFAGPRDQRRPHDAPADGTAAPTQGAEVPGGPAVARTPTAASSPTGSTTPPGRS